MERKRYDIFAIIELPNRSNPQQPYKRWLKVGRGFTNQDDSVNLLLDAVPTDGASTLQLRTHVPYEERQERFGGRHAAA